MQKKWLTFDQFCGKFFQIEGVEFICDSHEQTFLSTLYFKFRSLFIISRFLERRARWIDGRLDLRQLDDRRV